MRRFLLSCLVFITVFSGALGLAKPQPAYAAGGVPVISLAELAAFVSETAQTALRWIEEKLQWIREEIRDWEIFAQEEIAEEARLERKLASDTAGTDEANANTSNEHEMDRRFMQGQTDAAVAAQRQVLKAQNQITTATAADIACQVATAVAEKPRTEQVRAEAVDKMTEFFIQVIGQNKGSISENGPADAGNRLYAAYLSYCDPAESGGYAVNCTGSLASETTLSNTVQELMNTNGIDVSDPRLSIVLAILLTPRIPQLNPDIVASPDTEAKQIIVSDAERYKKELQALASSISEFISYRAVRSGERALAADTQIGACMQAGMTPETIEKNYGQGTSFMQQAWYRGVCMNTAAFVGAVGPGERGADVEARAAAAEARERAYHETRRMQNQAFLKDLASVRQLHEQAERDLSPRIRAANRGS